MTTTLQKRIVVLIAYILANKVIYPKFYFVDINGFLNISLKIYQSYNFVCIFYRTHFL